MVKIRIEYVLTQEEAIALKKLIGPISQKERICLGLTKEESTLCSNIYDKVIDKNGK